MNFALLAGLVGMALASATFAQNVDNSAQLNAWKDPYRWSVATVSLATAADLASSLKFSADGQTEGNALLRSSNGVYGAKGAAIEAGMVGGSLILQHYLVRKHPRLKVPLMVTNYALAGLQVFVVKHNLSY